MGEDKKRPFHVGLCLPSTGSHLSQTTGTIAGCAGLLAAAGVQVSIFNKMIAGVATCRNLLVKNALEAGTDYTLWIDSDHIFHPQLALDLLRHSQDIVGVTYPQRCPPYYINGRPCGMKLEDGPKYLPFADALSTLEGDLQEFDFLPFGAILVRTEVFRRIQDPWFFESYGFQGNDAEQLTAALVNSVTEDLDAQFVRDFADLARRYYPGLSKTRITNPGGEDFNFCRQARRAGFKIWCDVEWSKKIIHVGQQLVSIAVDIPDQPCKVVGQIG